jgi:hypothetical protein
VRCSCHSAGAASLALPTGSAGAASGFSPQAAPAILSESLATVSRKGIYAQYQWQLPEERFNSRGLGLVGFNHDGHRQQISRAAPGKLNDRNLLVVDYLKDTHFHVRAGIHQQ